MKKRFFVLKLVIAVLCVYTIWATTAVLIEDTLWEAESNTTEYHVRWCDERYYDREYERLREQLLLYDLYEADFDIYWEVINAYDDYLSWHAWNLAMQSGEMPIAEEKEKAARLQVELNASNCQFEKNQKILDGFVLEMNNN